MYSTEAIYYLAISPQPETGYSNERPFGPTGGGGRTELCRALSDKENARAGSERGEGASEGFGVNFRGPHRLPRSGAGRLREVRRGYSRASGDPGFAASQDKPTHAEALRRVWGAPE